MMKLQANRFFILINLIIGLYWILYHNLILERFLCALWNCIFQYIITFLQISHLVLSASHSYSFNIMNCVDFFNIYYSEFLISSYSNAIIFQLLSKFEFHFISFHEQFLMCLFTLNALVKFLSHSSHLNSKYFSWTICMCTITFSSKIFAT